MLHHTETLPDIPVFSQEELARIDAVYREYRDRYCPGWCQDCWGIKFRVCGVPRDVHLDMVKKIRDAELAAR